MQSYQYLMLPMLLNSMELRDWLKENIFKENLQGKYRGNICLKSFLSLHTYTHSHTHLGPLGMCISQRQTAKGKILIGL